MPAQEPIFRRDLEVERDRILDLVAMRCRATAEWVGEMEEVSALLKERPAFIALSPYDPALRARFPPER